MKKNICLLMVFATLFPISCSKSNHEEVIKNYTDKEVNVYREANKIDKAISLRFYDEHPHVPYINVSTYYHEFFDVDYFYTNSNGIYTYKSLFGGYLKFDAEHNYFISLDISDFSYLPHSVSSNSKIFVEYEKEKTTPKREKIIDLNAYNIDIYGENDGIYTPVTFLSDFSGADQLYTVAYNGKDLYVIDFGGSTTNGEKRDSTYYRDTYYEILGDFDTPREKDLAEYTYNELCLIFDNYRGYTSQLIMGDNNLLSLGLDGALEQYYPKIKQFLLSTNKEEYLIGYLSVFSTLYDGGHTTFLLGDVPNDLENENGFFMEYLPKAMAEGDLTEVVSKFFSKIYAQSMLLSLFKATKEDAFELETNDKGFYYSFDEESKTAYIGFDSFVTDYEGWDKFYKNEGEIPVNTDSYAFIRSKLYQALDDEAENVVLDLSTNGGGDTSALNGIYGLLCGAKGEFSMNNTLYKCRYTSPYKVDINLDGKYDEIDAEEASKFDFNYGILTTQSSFSCGNLLPSLLKEAGFKIIGQKSGGGSCSVHLGSTGDGLPFAKSSYLCISNKNGDNIDAGVPLDLDIHDDVAPEGPVIDAIPYFYDFSYIGSYLSSAY